MIRPSQPRLCRLITIGLVVLAKNLCANEEKPNVLLICIDDLRPVMGCYDGAAKTTNIDKFALSSVQFDRHYVQYPVCGPSRASMLGGLRPDSSGIYQIGDSWKISKHPESRPTMPYYFKAQGYTTRSFGKVFHGKGWGEGYGWSENPMHPETGWTCYVDFEMPDGDKKQSRKDGSYWRPAYEIYEGDDELHGDAMTATAAIQALETVKGEPFFFAVGFYKPHLPFVAPQWAWDLYEDEDVQAPGPRKRASGSSDLMYYWSEMNSYGRADNTLYSFDRPPTRDEVEDLTRAYYASTSFIDRQVGRLLDKLDELGLSENTAVVIWGDHGFHLGDQTRWAKHTQFDGAMRSPLIMRLPGVSVASGTMPEPVESVDIYPTLVDFCKLPMPAHLDGESLLPLMSGERSEPQYAYSQISPVDRKRHRYMAHTVRSKEYRYVEWRDSEDAFKLISRELYKLRGTYDETLNIVENPEYDSISQAHAEKLKSMFSHITD